MFACPTVRLLVPAFVLAVALGAAGCGSDDDEPDRAASGQPEAADVTERRSSEDGKARKAGGDEPAAGAPAKDGTASRGGDDGNAAAERSPSGAGAEKAVRRAVDRMLDASAAGDAKAICAGMSRAAQASFGGGTGLDGAVGGAQSCEASLASTFELAGGTDHLPKRSATSIRSVEVDGRRATVVTVTAGRSNRVRLVREGGEWRFATAPGGGRPATGGNLPGTSGL